MRRPSRLLFAVGLAGVAGVIAPALAQSTMDAPPVGGIAASPPPAAAPAAPANAAPGGDKAAIKALRAGCRDEAKGQGLKGEAKRAAVSACVVKARPALAGREQCRGDGRAKGLRGEGLRSFVKDCLKAKA